jgi:hypothetical protein
MTAILKSHDIPYAVEGELKPLAIQAPHDATVSHLLALIVAHLDREDLVEILFEDEDEPIAGDTLLAELLAGEFRLIHVASRGRIDVVLHHNGRKIEREFRPNATIRRVITWAISPRGFDLVGEPAEFQIKLDARPLSPDLHLGQVVRCGHKLDAKLVHNIKPQG